MYLPEDIVKNYRLPYMGHKYDQQIDANNRLFQNLIRGIDTSDIDFKIINKNKCNTNINICKMDRQEPSLKRIIELTYIINTFEIGNNGEMQVPTQFQSKMFKDIYTTIIRSTRFRQLFTGKTNDVLIRIPDELVTDHEIIRLALEYGEDSIESAMYWTGLSDPEIHEIVGDELYELACERSE
jgi:hypothetical protein